MPNLWVETHHGDLVRADAIVCIRTEAGQLFVHCSGGLVVQVVSSGSTPELTRSLLLAIATPVIDARLTVVISAHARRKRAGVQPGHPRITRLAAPRPAAEPPI